jgi:hypothetical protein
MRLERKSKDPENASVLIAARSFPWSTLTRKNHPLAPVLAQINPVRIDLFDKCNLLLSAPAFQLFLAADCFSYVIEALVVDEASAFIFLREAFDQAFLCSRTRFSM